MKPDTPYCRPRLTATANGSADPTVLIDLWVGQLVDRLDGPQGPEPATAAFDLLAGWARLRRARPELVQGELTADWQRIDQAVRAHAVDLVPRALSLPNAPGWLQEAARYDDAIELGQSNDAELSAWSEQLVADLDDALLVAWAARYFRQPDLELDQQLLECEHWLQDHAFAFTYGAVYVQSLGLTIDPDIDARDPELACTADPLVLLLDALEEAEAELREIPGPRWSRPAVERWRQRPAATTVLPAAPPQQEADWAPFAQHWLLAAADTPTGGMKSWQWRSPTGQFTATLVLGATPRPMVRVNFYEADDAAQTLAGQTAWLAGVAAVVDAPGNADFAVAELRAAAAAQQPLSLAVGTSDARWVQTSVDERT